jgi:hypothetical protein
MHSSSRNGLKVNLSDRRKEHKMKQISILIVFVVALFIQPAAILAQQGDQQGGGMMGGHQGNMMQGGPGMGGQNMMGMMSQMAEMMGKMSGMMQEMSPEKMGEMSELMERMSTHMMDMTNAMAHDGMPEEDLNSMHENMSQMQNRLYEMEQAQ